MVALNVTAVDPSGTGYLTVYPGGALPYASNVNFSAGATIPNFVMARVSDGKVVVFNSNGCTHVLIDVVGYTRVASGSGFTSLAPHRLKDTRTGLGGEIGPIGANATHTLTVTGPGTGVPASADTVVLNVTAVDPSATGYLTVYPADQSTPYVSNLNFSAGQTIPNLVIVKVSASGQVRFFNSAGTTDVIADVLGYFTAAGGDPYTPLSPARILDVRSTNALAAGEAREVQVTGLGGVPAAATAVVLNITAVDPTASAYLTVYPADQGAPPDASNLNFSAGRTIPNLVMVKLPPTGRIKIYNAAGSTGVIADVAGYFAAAPT